MVDSDPNSSSMIVGVDFAAAKQTLFDLDGVVKGSVVVVDSNPKAEQFFLFMYRIYIRKGGREEGCVALCVRILYKV